MEPAPKKRGRPSKKTQAPTEDVVVPTPAMSSVVESNTPDYILELIIGDEVYTGSGATTLEALQNLKRPAKIVSKSLLVVHHGSNSKELFFMPIQLKRLFFPLAQKTWAKTLMMGV